MDIIDIIVYVSVGIFILFGSITMIEGIEEIKLARKSVSWPTTTGIIISSGIKSSSGSDGVTTYRPSVKFSYQVNGIKFTGNKIFFGDGKIYSSNHNYAKKVVKQYVKQTIVQVSYNSEKPKQSVLETGVKIKTFSHFAFGSIFFILGTSAGILYPLSR